MSITKLRPAFTLTQDRLADLKSVVPEAFADGAINWEALKDALGDNLEDDSANAEHFGLFWPGKREARRLAAMPSKGALHPARGEGIDEDTTRNLFIEGDNLEVLNLLKKSYAGRVKMIYIDPPYNTGQDFIYKDDYRQPLESYLQQTGQIDERGFALTTNTKSDGRYHSKWLSMMYPRLLLARELLRDDGAIFVSIDDHEMQHLRMIMNEIFGEENFIACNVWQKRYSRDNRPVIGSVHEYILLYARDTEKFAQVRNLLPPDEERQRVYRNPNNDPRGRWRPIPMTAQGTRPNQMYKITTPAGVVHEPPKGRCWSMVESEYTKLLAQGRIWFGSDGRGQPNVIRYLTEVEGFVPWTWWPHTEVGHTDEAKKEIHEFFGKEDAFDTPKPVKLIKRMLSLATNPTEEAIVLDFFAGSCTTAQAVLEINRADDGNRRFIMVQLPEPTQNRQFATIAGIGTDRIRLVIARMLQQSQGQLPLQQAENSEDLGFKVYKLGRSNFREWQDYDGDDVEVVGTLFDQAVSPLMDDRRPDDVLTEVMLQEGFPLDSTVTRQTDLTMNAVLVVTSDACAHRLYVCLDNQIADATISQLRMDADDIFVCLDSALTDEAKMRLGDAHHVHVI